ncbi:MAG: metFprotein [Rhodospirillales bacterium]|jgi:methylenetetrahydrofolate reductase (NADPH)|nr:metFprotein [Rhodospirillales bacterium]MDP6773019.1 metFprotein [Rhodospirillales bacterium]
MPEPRPEDDGTRAGAVIAPPPGETPSGGAWDEAAARHRIIDFLSAFSIETTPREAARIADYRDHLRPGTVVYIAHVPGSAYDGVIELAKRLRGEGFHPVPHLAARSLTHRERLAEYLARLSGEADVEQILFIAGDYRSPVGPFESTLDVLETGLFERYGIGKIGVAGHPEGNRAMGRSVLRDALVRKNAYAARSAAEFYIVTQFGFDASAIVTWERSIREDANLLPVHVGMPGLASLRTLIKYALGCGIGPSMRLLTQNASSMANVVAIPAPDQMIAALAQHRADPECAIAGVHFFPFGGLRHTAQWLHATIDGKFTFREGGARFDVDATPG